MSAELKADESIHTAIQTKIEPEQPLYCCNSKKYVWPRRSCRKNLACCGWFEPCVYFRMIWRERFAGPRSTCETVYARACCTPKPYTSWLDRVFGSVQRWSSGCDVGSFDHAFLPARNALLQLFNTHPQSTCNLAYQQFFCTFCATTFCDLCQPVSKWNEHARLVFCVTRLSC